MVILMIAFIFYAIIRDDSRVKGLDLEIETSICLSGVLLAIVSGRYARVLFESRIKRCLRAETRV